LSLTSAGLPAVTGALPGTPVSIQSAAGTRLTAVLNFGDVGARNPNPQVRIVMPIRVSADTAYKVEVQRSIINGSSGVQPADIGFGVGQFRPQLPAPNRLTSNAVSGITTRGTFGSDPSAAPRDRNGRPQFQASLNQIATGAPTVIFSGPDMVAQGDAGDDRNSVLADLTFVITPQFYAVTSSFTIMLTVTISPA
jgi:hypothetical protein